MVELGEALKLLVHIKIKEKLIFVLELFFLYVVDSLLAFWKLSTFN